MKETQLNPQVADLAPAGPALTMYDEGEYHHALCVSSMPMRTVPTGAMSRGSSCILTRTATPTARGERSKATSRAPNG